MTALAAQLMITFDRWTRKQLPLQAAKKAYKGGTCMANLTAAAVHPAATAGGNTTDLFLGIFAETIDNTANTATTALVDVDFMRERTILWRANDGSITSANLFSPCYAVDDQTVSITSTNRAKCGTIVAVDAVLGVAFTVVDV